MAVGGSQYGKPNAPVQLTSVMCSGREANLTVCQSTLLTQEESQSTYPSISAAGVVCITATTSTATGVASNNVAFIFMVILIIGLIASMVILGG